MAGAINKVKSDLMAQWPHASLGGRERSHFTQVLFAAFQTGGRRAWSLLRSLTPMGPVFTRLSTAWRRL
jgi:hypothetical protein